MYEKTQGIIMHIRLQFTNADKFSLKIFLSSYSSFQIYFNYEIKGYIDTTVIGDCSSIPRTHAGWLQVTCNSSSRGSQVTVLCEHLGS